MRYRYVIQRPGEDGPVSRHTSRLGALDALARLRARADREGRQSSEYILHREDGSVVEPWECLDLDLDDESGPDSAPLMVRTTRRERARLRELAREFGALATSGREVGRPSVAQLLRLIAGGQLIISRRPSAG